MQHHVYFWLKEDCKDDATRAKFEAGLDACSSIEGIVSGGWGRQAATAERPVTDKTWDYALYATFETIEDHDAHQALKSKLTKILLEEKATIANTSDPHSHKKGTP